MPKRNNKSRSAIANGIHRMACTPKQAGHLLQGLRRNYRALTLKERNQVRAFILGVHGKDERSLGDAIR
jgi:hypothetical protein